MNTYLITIIKGGQVILTKSFELQDPVTPSISYISEVLVNNHILEELDQLDIDVFHPSVKILIHTEIPFDQQSLKQELFLEHTYQNLDLDPIIDKIRETLNNIHIDLEALPHQAKENLVKDILSNL